MARLRSCQRGVCSFQLKYNNVEKAGTITIIVYNDAAHGDDLITMGGDTAYPEPTIPGIFTGHTAGAANAAAIDGGGTVTATLSNYLEIPAPELADTMASFSSRGPGGGGTTFKPDLSAPGFPHSVDGSRHGDPRSQVQWYVDGIAPHCRGRGTAPSGVSGPSGRCDQVTAHELDDAGRGELPDRPTRESVWLTLTALRRSVPTRHRRA